MYHVPSTKHHEEISVVEKRDILKKAPQLILWGAFLFIPFTPQFRISTRMKNSNDNDFNTLQPHTFNTIHILVWIVYQ